MRKASRSLLTLKSRSLLTLILVSFDTDESMRKASESNARASPTPHSQASKLPVGFRVLGLGLRVQV
jgi:hypothetical protein